MGAHQEQVVSNSSAPSDPYPYCDKVSSEDASFMTNMRVRFSDFIHSPIDDHMACLKKTYQKLKEQSKEMLGVLKAGGEKPSNPQ